MKVVLKHDPVTDADGNELPPLQDVHQLRRDGQFEEAKRLYREYLKADDKNIFAWRGLARVFLATKEPQKGAEALWRAVMVNKNNIELLNELIDLLLKLGDFEKAIIVCRTAIARKPDDIRAYLSMAAMLRGQGEPEKGREVARHGIQRRPLFSQTCPREPAATILRMRGIQNAYYTIGQSRNGMLNMKLRGGNFSSRYLWNTNRFTTHSLWVQDENILSLKDIPNHQVVINVVADPDVEMESLQTLSKFIEAKIDRPVINHPDQVALTGRDTNYRRINDLDGFVFGKTTRLTLPGDGSFNIETYMETEGFEFPVILRSTGTHTGRTVLKAESLQDAKSYCEEYKGEEIYVIQYVENSFRKDYHRKMRFFFIDGVPYPVVHHIDDYWNVHGSNRRKLMGPNGWMTDVEKDFMADPEKFLGSEVYGRLLSLPDLVKLEFFGIDFTLTDEGEILVFEMNPAMRHAFDHADNFEYLRPYMQNVTDAFQDMIIDRATR